jgi:hypothetical protein
MREHLDIAVKASIAPWMMLLGLVQRYGFTGPDLSVRNLQNKAFLKRLWIMKPEAFLVVLKGGTSREFIKYFLQKSSNSLRLLIQSPIYFVYTE